MAHYTRLFTETSTRSCCKIIQDFRADSLGSLPRRDRCCACRGTYFHKVHRFVSHPGVYHCQSCRHDIPADPIETPQVYRACTNCRHSCAACCGPDYPKTFETVFECGACSAVTKVNLIPGDQRRSPWKRLTICTFGGQRRWGGVCRGCGYETPSEGSKKLEEKMFKTFELIDGHGWDLVEC